MLLKSYLAFAAAHIVVDLNWDRVFEVVHDPVQIAFMTGNNPAALVQCLRWSAAVGCSAWLPGPVPCTFS